MIVAIVALVVALSGTAVAAGVLITSSKQIANGVITGNKLQNGTIGGSKIQNGAISTSKLSSGIVSQLGSTGGGSTALEWVRKNGPEGQSPGATQRLITTDTVPPGIYAIYAKAIVTDLEPPQVPLLTVGKTADAQCVLSAGGDVDTGRVLIGTGFGSGPGDVSAQITHTFAGPGTITLECNATSTWRASDSTVIAIKLSGASRMSVTG
jgi:hypothetical protein